MNLKIKNIAPIFVVIAAAILFCGTTMGYAQDRERPHAVDPQMEGMHGGERPHTRDGDRDHLHRPAVIVVGVPSFVDPAYTSNYLAPPMDAYRTLDGFYYYCAELAGYYPALQDCPSGWRLVP
jgi:hypothetical protein